MAGAFSWRPEVRLPRLTAIWVLGAHVYALLVPVVLLAATFRHWEALNARADYPWVLPFAACMMLAASLFEVAQNSIDQWYLTPESGSANGTGVCDLLFYLCLVVSQAAVAIAFGGKVEVIALVALTCVVLQPVLYVRQLVAFVPLAVAGLLSTLVAWYRLGDPVVLLQLALTPLTLLFFSCLLRTGAQVLHGFTTIAASSGAVFLAMGIEGAARGAPRSASVVLIAGCALVLAGLAARPVMLRLGRTPPRLRR